VTAGAQRLLRIAPGQRGLVGLLAAAVLIAAGGLSRPADAAGSDSVHPGDAITIAGAGCTVGFLLLGSDGQRYMTTAGHCVVDENTRLSWRPGRGPVVRAADGRRIGTIVFAEDVDAVEADDEFDFALLRLDSATKASPDIRDLGAPSRINESTSNDPAVLRALGSQSAAGSARATRELLTKSLKRPEFVYADGALAPGDSGAPVVDANGDAVGTVLGAGGNHVGVGLDGASLGHDGSINRIGRLRPVLSHAEAELRLQLRLAPEPSG
jgi:hypothetical protein